MKYSHKSRKWENTLSILHIFADCSFFLLNMMVSDRYPKKDNFVLINIRGRFKKAKVVSPRRMLRELKKMSGEL